MLKYLVDISSGAFEVQKLGVTFFSVPWTSCGDMGGWIRVDKVSLRLHGLAWADFLIWAQCFTWWSLVTEQEDARAFLCEVLDLLCESWSQSGDLYIKVY